MNLLKKWLRSFRLAFSEYPAKARSPKAAAEKYNKAKRQVFSEITKTEHERLIREARNINLNRID